MRYILRMVVLGCILTIMGGWGFLVHRTVNQLSVYELPLSMRSFFFRHMDYLVKNSVRPDLRRNEDSTEATKHFIDLEIYGDSAAWKMPAGWSAARAKYTEDTLRKYGYVPYYVITMKDRLTRAFRNRKADSILFYAADMAHYIGDAHVPLHTTVNYDGQLTGQNGLHALWETVVPELELPSYKLNSRHKAAYLADPEKAIWSAVREAYQLLPGVFREEAEASRLFTDSTKYRIQVRRGREQKYYTSTFAREYGKRLNETINRQLIRSANLVSDFWYTCWVDAGKPELETLLVPALSHSENKRCRQETKAFRKNRLLNNKWLLSWQKDDKAGNNNP